MQHLPAGGRAVARRSNPSTRSRPSRSLCHGPGPASAPRSSSARRADTASRCATTRSMPPRSCSARPRARSGPGPATTSRRSGMPRPGSHCAAAPRSGTPGTPPAVRAACGAGSGYRSLLRARALALSRLGRRAEAAAPLGELILQGPRDEEVLAELLRCEAATAGPAAALARYADYRQRLRESSAATRVPRCRACTRSCCRPTRR